MGVYLTLPCAAGLPKREKPLPVHFQDAGGVREGLSIEAFWLIYIEFLPH